MLCNPAVGIWWRRWKHQLKIRSGTRRGQSSPLLLLLLLLRLLLVLVLPLLLVLLLLLMGALSSAKPTSATRHSSVVSKWLGLRHCTAYRARHRARDGSSGTRGCVVKR